MKVTRASERSELKSIPNERDESERSELKSIPNERGESERASQPAPCGVAFLTSSSILLASGQ
ncbi:UNVERIFIED_CONTAM: hypothetical protein FKN15_072527 [Acipenser sinensis]